MEYIRLSENYNKNILIPATDSPYKHIDSLSKPWFVSMMRYNEDAYKQWKSTGSLAGIEGSTTNKIWWDFDSDNLNNSLDDTRVLFTRLNEAGFDVNTIQIAFSGNKGFSVVLETTNNLNIIQVRSIAFKFASDLSTFDSKIYDNQRIFRVLLSKNEKSGLYKFPINHNDLFDLTIEQIKKEAQHNDYDIDAITNYYRLMSLPDELLLVKEEPKIVKPLVVPEDLDFSKKPKHLSSCRWSLQNGNFLSGSRSNALLCLGATYKNQGFNLEQVYRLLKGVAETQAQVNNVDRFDDKRLYNTIVTQLFSSKWENGQFTCRDKDSWLGKYCQSLGTNKCNHEEISVVKTDDVFSLFSQYAVDYDKNVLFTGIEELDKKMKLLVGTSNAILGPPGIGKCLGKDTPVLMYDGRIKLVQDVKVGDVLMGDDSTPRNVLSTCTGQEQLYRINQQHGDSYVINESHILSLKCGASMQRPGLKKKYIKDKVQDINVLEYLSSSNTFKKYFKGYKVPVEYETKTLHLDPYILGYWLGNGSTGKPEFSLHKQEIEVCNYLENFANSRNLNYNTRLESDNCINVAISGTKGQKNNFSEDLRQLEVFDNKHIPVRYMLGNRKQRLDLLAGILDSDGYYNSEYGLYELTFKDETLLKSTIRLSQSLGFKASFKKVLKKWNSLSKGKHYKGEDFYYRTFISGQGIDEIPCKVPRKQARKNISKENGLLSKITVDKLEVGDYYGFEIDGNHRFLLGDFTVTHNTSIILQILQNNSNKGVPSILFSYDMFHSALFLRMVQKETGYSQDKIFSIFRNVPEEQKKIQAILNEKYKNIHFCFKAGQSSSELEETIMDVENKTGEKIKLAVIDYNDLITSDFSDSTAASNQTAQRLRQIANERKLCVLNLLQPSKQYTSPSDEITSYNAAKGSSAIAQSLTLMLGCSRPGFNPRNPDEDKYFNITCLKNRNGPLFSLDFSWNGLQGTIGKLSDEERGELAALRERKKIEKENGDKEWN